MNARELALRALYDVEQKGSYSDMVLLKLMREHQLSSVDKGLATELTYGVITYKRRIDCVIKNYSSQKIKKLSAWILNILRLGIYQILFLDKIPASAAVDECVKLAKKYGHTASSGFVNGVLRSVAEKGDIKYSSVADFYSHPEWLCELLEAQYPDEYKSILKANNQNPGTTVRVNTLKTTAEELREKIGGEIVYDNMLKIEGGFASGDEFKNGLFSPQDIASYRTACAVSPKENEFIIDVCAAPGGKTCAMAELSGDKAQIVAFDMYGKKVNTIRETAKRLGITSITARLHNSEEVLEEYIGKADRVLADVPCSGLGIIRKKPDIKWTKSASDLDALIPIQKKILHSASQYVKDCGVLVYSTCTVNRNENEGVTAEFVKNNPFEIVEEYKLLPPETDGFYICKMKKRM